MQFSIKKTPFIGFIKNRQCRKMHFLKWGELTSLNIRVRVKSAGFEKSKLTKITSLHYRIISIIFYHHWRLKLTSQLIRDNKWPHRRPYGILRGLITNVTHITLSVAVICGHGAFVKISRREINYQKMANRSKLIDCLTEFEIKLSMKTLGDLWCPEDRGKLNICISSTW